jgi:pimeloyl-ACP methyl ester carboxylesterase
MRFNFNIEKIRNDLKQKLMKAKIKYRRLKKAFYKLLGESDYKNASQNMKQTMINLLNSDKSLKPENIQTPTLIFWGKEDKITPVSDGRLLNRLIKNSEFFLIDNAHHSPQATNPEEVAEIIYEYI